MESLRDSSGKCCPNKCNKQLDRITNSIDNLVNKVLNSLSKRLADKEEQLGKLTQTPKEQLDERLDRIDKALDNLHREVQNPLISRLANAQAKAEKLMSGEPTEPESEPEPEREPEHEPESESEPERTPEAASSTSKSRESSNVPSKESKERTPESPKPFMGNKRPSDSGNKKKEDCPKIDFCDDFYALLRQWQEQSYKQSQKMSDTYKACCDEDHPDEEKQEKDFKPFAIKAGSRMPSIEVEE